MSLVAILAVVLCGESLSCGVSVGCVASNEDQTEMTITDADIPNLTSLLSGQGSSRSITNSSRRHLQRNSNKRVKENYTVQRSDLGVAYFAHSHYDIEPNIIGGVASERAFYSLCCLRI